MKKITWIFLSITLLLGACRGEDFIEEVAIFNPELRINTEFNANGDSIAVGDTVLLMATFLNSEGQELDVTVSWTSSRPDIASIDSIGQLVGLARGVTNIVATANGLSAERLIVIEGERIEISADTTSLLVGDELQFSARYFDRRNTLTPANVTWRSSNLGVARIDSTGNLTAIAYGDVTITASFNGVSSNSIELNIADIERVELTVSDTLVAVEEQLIASAIYFDQTGTRVQANIEWNSSNTAVATIDNAGTITGIAKGRTQITARANGLTSNVVSVEVIDDTTIAVGIDISSAQSSIIVGNNLQFSGLVRNINGNTLNEPIQWTSSNTLALTIDGNGLATALSAGSSVVSATTASGLTSNAITVNVTNLERVELSLFDSLIVVGEQRTASAVYFNSSGIQTPTNFTWRSSNPAIATVDNAGTIRGLNRGIVQITATANGVSSNVRFVEVIDDSTIVASVSISTTSSTSINVGSSLQFSAIARNSNGKLLPNQNIQWVTSDPVVLGIDGNGLATAASVGSSTVTARVGGIQSNGVNVLVTPTVTSRTGNFVSANGYRTSGSVELESLSSNALQLDFTNFSASRGPALYIYLGNSPNSIAGAIQLERLNGRNGAFTVPVPASVGINTYNYVIIWCEAIRQSFGAARLM